MSDPTERLAEAVREWMRRPLNRDGRRPSDDLALALAPVVREAQAEALREAADAIEAVRESGTLPDGVSSHLIVGDDWLRERADRIEAQP